MNILIAGCGSLGYRYFQSLISISQNINLHLYDIDPFSFERFLLPDLIPAHITITSTTDILSLNGLFFDIVIVSSVSTNRVELISSLATLCHVSSWIIEKLLAQSLSELSVLSSLKLSNAFVNTYRRDSPVWQHLRRLNSSNPFTICQVSGHGWNMASNSIHFLDAFEYILESPPISISTSNLELIPSSRCGFKELTGTLTLLFPSTRVDLISNQAVQPYQIIFLNDLGMTKTDELSLHLPDGSILSYPEYFLSERMTNILSLLYMTGVTTLTPLNDSIRQHILMTTALVDILPLETPGIIPFT
jgi:hypothetical protein